MGSTRPPGPRGDRWSGCLAEYEQDRLGFLLRARDEHGGLVAFDSTTTIVNDAHLAGEVLGSADCFAILGNFLNRRLSAADALATREVRTHLNAGLRWRATTGLTLPTEAAVLGGLAASPDTSDGIDPLPVLEKAISDVVAGFYFGAEHARPVARATHGLLDALSAVFGNPLALPMSLPTPANLRIRRRYRQLRDAIGPLVAERAEPPGPDDYAAKVVRSARTAGTPPDRVTDLLIGSLLAAQRVPAAAAAWTLLELARSPEWAAAARDSPADLRAAVTESMRLHPPTWLLRRVSTTAVELGGYRFPAGHNFLVSPWVIHRDPALFAAPAEFRPARWQDGSSDHRDLLSFGAGLHRCPGKDASGTILTAAVGAVLRTYALEDVSRSVREEARTTLVPSGLALRLTVYPCVGDALGSGGGRPRAEVLDALGEALPG